MEFEMHFMKEQFTDMKHFWKCAFKKVEPATTWCSASTRSGVALPVHLSPSGRRWPRTLVTQTVNRATVLVNGRNRNPPPFIFHFIWPIDPSRVPRLKIQTPGHPNPDRHCTERGERSCISHSRRVNAVRDNIDSERSPFDSNCIRQNNLAGLRSSLSPCADKNNPRQLTEFFPLLDVSS